MPTVIPINYIGAVNLEIRSNPEDIGWRVVDDEAGRSIFGYSAGWYEEPGDFVQFINLQTGVWEFQVFRDSVDADAVVEIGIVNTATGDFEVIDTLDFATSSDNVLTTMFTLD